MGRRNAWAAFTLAAIFLSGMLVLNSIWLSGIHAAPAGTHPRGGASGWLRGRVTSAFTGLGIMAVVLASGPQLLAWSTDLQGYYAVQLPEGRYTVSAFKGRFSAEATKVIVSAVKPAIVNFALPIKTEGQHPLPRPAPGPSVTISSPTPNPIPSPTPNPVPSPTPTPAPPAGSISRRPQLVAVMVGQYKNSIITLDNAPMFATRYDWIIVHDDGWATDPTSVAAALRKANPSIVLLRYSLPGGTQQPSKYPDSYYKRSLNTGKKVKNNNGWYLLDFSQAAVRDAIRDELVEMIGPSKGPLDGWMMDVAHPNWLNTPGLQWTDTDGVCADLGDWDGGWDCSMPRSEAWNFTNAQWATYMLTFHQGLAAAAPRKIRMFNGFLKTHQRYNLWKTHEDAYIVVNSGAFGGDGIWFGGSQFVGEETWKFGLDRLIAIAASGKLVAAWPKPTKAGEEEANLQFLFGSYLLAADGQRVIYKLQNHAHYDDSLLNTDYGTPDTSVNGGHYQTLAASPGGNIYKRTFTKARVWVNPSGSTRRADGKTLGPYTALIETFGR